MLGNGHGRSNPAHTDDHVGQGDDHRGGHGHSGGHDDDTDDDDCDDGDGDGEPENALCVSPPTNAACQLLPTPERA
jgi:hypothetical protein